MCGFYMILKFPLRSLMLTWNWCIGFIRINPATAPLNPPGAAPTLTTIYDEQAGTIPSDFVSPTNSLSKESPAPAVKRKSKRRHRIGLTGKPAPASAGVEGTKTEKNRTQQIADSLDLGMELSPDLPDGQEADVPRRRGTVAAAGEPIRVIRNGDPKLKLKDGKRAGVGANVHRGERRASVG
ncbi:hypothetical protein ACLMJK_008957 [Lecanora helva]